MGYKPPEPPRQFDEQAAAELAQIIPVVSKHVPIDTGAWDAFMSDNPTQH